MSSGRFSCIVCNHKPVFDTVDMLMVHRGGKRHHASALYRQQEQEELQELIRKRRQEQLEKTGSADIKIASSHFKGLGNVAPYDSRVKKKKLKPYDRKPVLALSSSQSTSTDSTVPSSLPGNRSGEVLTLQNKGPVKHPTQLKKIFENPNSHFQIKPYQRQSKQEQNYSEIRPESQGREKVFSDVIRPEPSASKPRGSGPQCGTVCTASLSHSSTVQSSENHVSKEGKTTTLSSEQQELAGKYWQLRGSGWKKDWDGKWIRDEDCEFDSDEEPPDLP